jgi:hypothetical protein
MVVGAFEQADCGIARATACFEYHVTVLNSLSSFLSAIISRALQIPVYLFDIGG